MELNVNIDNLKKYLDLLENPLIKFKEELKLAFDLNNISKLDFEDLVELYNYNHRDETKHKRVETAAKDRNHRVKFILETSLNMSNDFISSNELISRYFKIESSSHYVRNLNSALVEAGVLIAPSKKGNYYIIDERYRAFTRRVSHKIYWIYDPISKILDSFFSKNPTRLDSFTRVDPNINIAKKKFELIISSRVVLKIFYANGITLDNIDLNRMVRRFHIIMFDLGYLKSGGTSARQKYVFNSETDIGKWLSGFYRWNYNKVVDILTAENKMDELLSYLVRQK